MYYFFGISSIDNIVKNRIKKMYFRRKTLITILYRSIIYNWANDTIIYYYSRRSDIKNIIDNVLSKYNKHITNNSPILRCKILFIKIYLERNQCSYSDIQYHIFQYLKHSETDSMKYVFDCIINILLNDRDMDSKEIYEKLNSILLRFSSSINLFYTDVLNTIVKQYLRNAKNTMFDVIHDIKGIIYKNEFVGLFSYTKHIHNSCNHKINEYFICVDDSYRNYTNLEWMSLDYNIKTKISPIMYKYSNIDRYTLINRDFDYFNTATFKKIKNCYVIILFHLMYYLSKNLIEFHIRRTNIKTMKLIYHGYHD